MRALSPCIPLGDAWWVRGLCACSAGPNLHLEDDPMAPWRLCNDKDVTLVQYADIKTKILRSCNDSAYMLFYRQLDGDSVPPCTSLPAEAVRCDAVC